MPRFHEPPKMVHFKHPEGGTVKVGACHKDPHDASHVRYEAKAWTPDELPAYVDLRPHLTPVENQGDLGSCTANALAGAVEYLEKRISNKGERVSRLFIYYNERRADGEVNQDHGAALSEGIKSLKQDGACAEKLWPYDKRKVFEQPNHDAYHAASPHKIDEAQKVSVELHDMKHCLAEGYPFVFGMEIYDQFEKDGTENSGLITTPEPGTHEKAGGHAMLCVGYSDKDEVFLVRNSWGESWGDAGYCYVPYEYLANAKYTHDCWTVRKAHDLDFSQGAGGGELPHGATNTFFGGDDSADTTDQDDTTTDDDSTTADDDNASSDDDDKTDADDTTNSDDTTDPDDGTDSDDTTDTDESTDADDAADADESTDADETEDADASEEEESDDSGSDEEKADDGESTEEAVEEIDEEIAELEKKKKALEKKHR